MNILLLVSSFLAVLFVQGYYLWKFKRFERQAKALLEQKVDEVISALKAEIPMAETFLRGSLDDKLRKKAKSLVQGLPERLKSGESKADWLFVPWLAALVIAWVLSFL